MIGGVRMKKEDKEKENSKIDTDDGWIRAVYGSPTIGGFIVVAIITAVIIYNVYL